MVIRHLSTLVLLLLLGEGLLIAAKEDFGTAIEVEGEVKVKRRFKLLDVKPEDTLRVKDQINTGDASKIEIRLSPKNHMRIDSNTKLTLERPGKEEKSGKEMIMIKLMAGTVRTKLDGLMESNEVFSIRTPSAVAGVRGTDFVTSYNPALGAKAFSLTVIKGEVEVKGIAEAAQGAAKSVFVKPSQQVVFNDKGQFKGILKINSKKLSELKRVHPVRNEGKKDIKEHQKIKKDKDKDKKKDKDDASKEDDSGDEADSKEDDNSEEGDGDSQDGDADNQDESGEDDDSGTADEGDTKEGTEDGDTTTEGDDKTTDDSGDTDDSGTSDDTEPGDETTTDDSSTGETTDGSDTTAGDDTGDSTTTDGTTNTDGSTGTADTTDSTGDSTDGTTTDTGDTSTTDGTTDTTVTDTGTTTDVGDVTVTDTTTLDDTTTDIDIGDLGTIVSDAEDVATDVIDDQTTEIVEEITQEVTSEYIKIIFQSAD